MKERTRGEVKEALTRVGDMLAADVAAKNDGAYSLETIEAMRLVVSDALGEWFEMQQEIDDLTAGRQESPKSSMSESEKKDLRAGWEYLGDLKANIEKLRERNPLAIDCSNLFFDRIRNAIVAAETALANNAMEIDDLRSQVEYWKGQVR